MPHVGKMPWAVLSFILFVLPVAQAQVSRAPAAGTARACDAQCKRLRVGALEQFAGRLRQAAAMNAPATVPAEQRAQIERFNAWAAEYAARALRLAAIGRAELSGKSDAAISFNSEYVAFQQRIQQESKRFQQASAPMKSRNDAALDAIRNMK
jgi:hypothetical protein